jgi:hypothetical protein
MNKEALCNAGEKLLSLKLSFLSTTNIIGTEITCFLEVSFTSQIPLSFLGWCKDD